MRPLAALLVLLLLPGAASAQPGDLDRSFGGDGVVVGTAYGDAEVLRPFADGSMIALWNRALTRIHADGSREPLTASSATHVGAVPLPVGFAVLDHPGLGAGPAPPPRVLRLDAAGRPAGDASVLPTPAASYWQGLTLHADAQGRVLVLGTRVASATAPPEHLAVRFGAGGALDQRFGQGGVAPVRYGEAAAVLPGGRFVIGESGAHAPLLRFTATGTADRPSALRGRYTYTMYGAVLPVGRGRLLVESHADRNIGHIVRRLRDGRRDPAFHEIRTRRDVVALAVDRRGRVLTGSNHLDRRFIEVRRYRADGRPDPTFRTARIQRLRPGWTGAWAGSIVVDTAGRIVVSGWMSDGRETGKLGIGRAHPLVVRLEG